MNVSLLLVRIKKSFHLLNKNKEEFSLIESIGIANLSSDQLKDMVAKYFIH